MRIFIPFTRLRANTLLRALGAKLVPLSTPNDYARYFRQRWREGLTFINLEHDVVPTNGLLSEIWKCSEPICLTRCVLSPGSAPAHWHLGCVKISDRFIAEHPIIWDGVHWKDCDSTIWTAHGGDDKPVCVHGEVEHLHYTDP